MHNPEITNDHALELAVKPEDFEQSKTVAKQGGNIANVARREIETRTGTKVATSINAKMALKA